MDIVNDKIYTMNDDVYVIINQERAIQLSVYYFKSKKMFETISNFTRLQQQYYYSDKDDLYNPIESLGPSRKHLICIRNCQKHPWKV